MTVSILTTWIKSVFAFLFVCFKLFILPQKFDRDMLLVLRLFVELLSVIPTFESVNGVDDINNEARKV